AQFATRAGSTRNAARARTSRDTDARRHARVVHRWMRRRRAAPLRARVRIAARYGAHHDVLGTSADARRAPPSTTTLTVRGRGYAVANGQLVQVPEEVGSCAVV